ncbi:LADA_0G03774g1_1 [Lachancea dasiensis]|uniref:Meiotic nuclear division protein 1 n=1 Tax=Lachancea dasiensis TaxID=1072105 RepID=A0A1G4JRT9_9SACH|nr:LADA_0G03774g1_1 [Lachancea dasiensis]
MPPKGRATVSVGQKKASILQFFQDEHSVYNIKELEKLIPKKCNGVSSMLVKSLIHEMIDEDGIISVEKCGSTNIYWCFKNQIIMKTRQELTSLHSRIDIAQRDIMQNKALVQENQSSIRKENYQVEGKAVCRSEQLARLDALDAQLKVLRTVLEQKTENQWDQEKISERNRMFSSQILKLESVTDNIELLTSFLCRQFMIDVKSLKTELEIPEEFVEFAHLPNFT